MKLIGYCAESENRLLVYEYMPKGSLESHLFRSKKFSFHLSQLQLLFRSSNSDGYLFFFSSEEFRSRKIFDLVNFDFSNLLREVSLKVGHFGSNPI